MPYNLVLERSRHFKTGTVENIVFLYTILYWTLSWKSELQHSSTLLRPKPLIDWAFFPQLPHQLRVVLCGCSYFPISTTPPILWNAQWSSTKKLESGDDNHAAYDRLIAYVAAGVLTPASVGTELNTPR